VARKQGPTPDALLAEYPPPIAALATELRAVFREHLPEAKEVAYPGWRAVGYRHPDAGNVGGIFLFEDHVSIIFEHGHLLPDPAGILQGDTKQTRYIPLAPGDSLPLDALADLLTAAVDISRDLRAARRT
jgi:hypothetical protein